MECEWVHENNVYESGDRVEHLILRSFICITRECTY